MTNVTTGNVMTAGGLAELVDRTAIKVFDESFFFKQFGTERMLPKGYNTFQFTLYDNMTGTASALTEGVTPTESALNLTGVDVSLAEYGDYVTITNIAATDSPVDLVVHATSRLVQKIARSVDYAYQGVIDNSTTHVIYGSAGDATTNRVNVDATDIIQVEDLFNAARILDRNSAPRFGQDFIAIMHPDVAYDLKTATGTNDWVSVNAYTDNVEKIFAGELGRIGGVRVIETPSIQFYANASNGAGAAGDVDVYPTYIIGVDAFGHVTSGGMQTFIEWFGSAGSTDPLHQRMTVGAKMRIGFALLREEALVRLETSSSKGTNA